MYIVAFSLLAQNDTPSLNRARGSDLQSYGNASIMRNAGRVLLSSLRYTTDIISRPVPETAATKMLCYLRSMAFAMLHEIAAHLYYHVPDSARKLENHTS